MLNLESLFKISYGIYLLCSKKEDGTPAGCLVNTVFQLTAEPVRVGVSVSKQNQTHDAIMHSKTLTVSVMGEKTPPPLLGRFGYRSGRDFDKFEGVETSCDTQGNAVIKDGVVSWMGCKVEQAVDVDTHTLFICSVQEGESVSEDDPMTYKYYRDVIRLKSSPNAPTYTPPNNDK